MIWRHRLARIQLYVPVVQRASHAFAKYDALRQRTALVRAAIQQGKDLVLRIAKDRDIGRPNALHDARALRDHILALEP